MKFIACSILTTLFATTALYAAEPHANADLNADGRVDATDLARMSAVFFTTDSRADLNRDGRVDFSDLALMKAALTGRSSDSGVGTLVAPRVYLRPPTQNVTVGEIVTVDLYWNFTGEAALGGGTDVRWLPSAFSLEDFEFVDNFGTGPGRFDPIFTRGDDEMIESPGMIDGLATGNFDGLGDPGPIRIATLRFEARKPGTFTIAASEDDGIAGPFVSAVNFDLYPDLAFTGAAINVAPAVAGPDIRARPVVTFEATRVGQTRSLTYGASNVGGAPLQIGQIGGIDPLAAPFAIGLDRCSMIALAPGEKCGMTLTFAPTAVGTVSDEFNVPSNDPDTPSLTVHVGGFGAAQIGMTGTQIAATAGKCTNRTTTQEITVPLSGGTQLPCEGVGLNAISGDALTVAMFGVAQSAASLSGRALGTTVERVQCSNETTGTKVNITDGNATWDCVAAGLRMSPGDSVSMIVRGTAI